MEPFVCLGCRYFLSHDLVYPKMSHAYVFEKSVRAEKLSGRTDFSKNSVFHF